MQPHGFNEVAVVKFIVFVTTGPGCLFTKQVVKFSKELTNLREFLLQKDLGVIPFEENSSKWIIEDDVPKDFNALKSWVVEWNVKWDWDDEECFTIKLKLGHDKDIHEIPSNPEAMEFMDKQGASVAQDEIPKLNRINLGHFWD